MVALDVLRMQTGSRETMSRKFLAEIIDANERARTATRQNHLLYAAFNYGFHNIVAVFVEGVVKQMCMRINQIHFFDNFLFQAANLTKIILILRCF
jgi:hypothetical protein